LLVPLDDDDDDDDKADKQSSSSLAQTTMQDDCKEDWINMTCSELVSQAPANPVQRARPKSMTTTDPLCCRTSVGFRKQVMLSVVWSSVQQLLARQLSSFQTELFCAVGLCHATQNHGIESSKLVALFLCCCALLAPNPIMNKALFVT
jgi:hypothetical protein